MRLVTPNMGQRFRPHVDLLRLIRSGTSLIMLLIAGGTFSGGPNYIDFLVANYNDTLVLSYNFASGGATITDSIVKTGVPQINTFQEQVEQLFRPKYSTQKDYPNGWASDFSIFTILIGINE